MTVCLSYIIFFLLSPGFDIRGFEMSFCHLYTIRKIHFYLKLSLCGGKAITRSRLQL
jgi:hypothetical protein